MRNRNPKLVRVFQHCCFDSKRRDASCGFVGGAEVLSLHPRRPHGGDGAKLWFNLVKADAFYHPNTARNVEERKHYMTLAIADLQQLYQDLQCLMAMNLPVKVARFEAISESIESDIKADKGMRCAGVKARWEGGKMVARCPLEIIASIGGCAPSSGGSSSNACNVNSNGNHQQQCPTNDWIRPCRDSQALPDRAAHKRRAPLPEEGRGDRGRKP